MKTKEIALIGSGIVILVFMVQNTQTAGINFLFWNLSMPIIILMAIVMVIGIVIGIYLGRNKKI